MGSEQALTAAWMECKKEAALTRTLILKSQVDLLLSAMQKRTIKKRVTGIEPASPAWEAGVLPMNYTRLSLQTLLYHKLTGNQEEILNFLIFLFFSNNSTNRSRLQRMSISLCLTIP